MQWELFSLRFPCFLLVCFVQIKFEETIIKFWLKLSLMASHFLRIKTEILHVAARPHLPFQHCLCSALFSCCSHAPHPPTLIVLPVIFFWPLTLPPPHLVKSYSPAKSQLKKLFIREAIALGIYLNFVIVVIWLVSPSDRNLDESLLRICLSLLLVEPLVSNTGPGTWCSQNLSLNEMFLICQP